ncbi:MAG: 2-dehydropantoate 2-reductase [Burkholderiales bacterium]
MKICVVGAGSIGGMLGAKLALSGEDVALIARGPHLDAIRKNGLKLVAHDGAESVAKNVKATSSMAEVGVQDVVILGMKAQQLPPVAADLRVMFGPDTVVVPTQNGVPFWYFQKHGGELDGRVVESVDPGGVCVKNIEPERIVGCVVYPAAEIAAPGVIRVFEGDRFPIGELDGSETERAKRISDAVVRAGYKSPILPNIRSEMWLKLWGNLTFNPISALSHSTLVDICQYPPSRDLAAKMMTEAQAIANKLGIEFRVPLDKRIAGAEKVGKHKTSMLQDVEVGRVLEIDALVGAVVELGRMTDTPTPHIDAVYALTKLLDKTMQEEKVFIRAQRRS